MVSGYLTPFIRIVCLVVFCLVWERHPLMSREAQEYKVKAAFLYNFIKFVQWPETVFLHGDIPYRICVMGDADIFNQFKVIEGKKNQQRSIQVLERGVAPPGGSRPLDCHVLFISRDTPRQVARQAIGSTAGKPVLIVGETRGFISLGGSINFFFKDDRLQFEIYPDGAAARGLGISSRLLKLAVIVEASK